MDGRLNRIFFGLILSCAMNIYSMEQEHEVMDVESKHAHMSKSDNIQTLDAIVAQEVQSLSDHGISLDCWLKEEKDTRAILERIVSTAQELPEDRKLRYVQIWLMELPILDKGFVYQVIEHIYAPELNNATIHTGTVREKAYQQFEINKMLRKLMSNADWYNRDTLDKAFASLTSYTNHYLLDSIIEFLKAVEVTNQQLLDTYPLLSEDKTRILECGFKIAGFSQNAPLLAQFMKQYEHVIAAHLEETHKKKRLMPWIQEQLIVALDNILHDFPTLEQKAENITLFKHTCDHYLLDIKWFYELFIIINHNCVHNNALCTDIMNAMMIHQAKLQKCIKVLGSEKYAVIAPTLLPIFHCILNSFQSLIDELKTKIK